MDQAKVFLKVPLVRQSTTYTCGCAALQSVLGYFGHDLREGAISQATGATPEDGTNYLRMLDFVRSLGFGIETETRENMSLEDLRGFLREGSPVMIALQSWNEKAYDDESGLIDENYDYSSCWDDGHYVVVIGFDDGRFFCMDPRYRVPLVALFSSLSLSSISPLALWGITPSFRIGRLSRDGTIFTWKGDNGWSCNPLA